jgi:Core-2/I-Branching enzyme
MQDTSSSIASGLSTPRVLYIIQTFDWLAQIQRLVKTILTSDPRGYVVICHNSDRFSVSDDDIGEPLRARVINQPGGNRVDFYMVDTYLQALSLAIREGFDFDWVMNLTGQCYPLRSLANFGAELTRRGADAFLLHRKVLQEREDLWGIWEKREAQSRYSYRYKWRLTRDELPRLPRMAMRVVREGVNRIQPWVRLDTSYALQIGLRNKQPFLPEGWDLFGGIWYMTLGRKAASHLLNFAQSHPDAMEHFREMNIPSEVFAHTILANQPDLKLSQHMMLYVDFSQAVRGRPRVLTSADIEALRRADHFFARKFDPRADTLVFDRLDEYVLRTGFEQRRAA